MYTATNFGIHRAKEVRPNDQALSDLCLQLGDYAATIPDAITSFYLGTAGFQSSDPRIVRLISIAAQKFISDVTNDSLQHYKTRTNRTVYSYPAYRNPIAKLQQHKHCLTMEDLGAALKERGIIVRKAHYFA